MIVQPDYFDHWKTRLLAETLGSELAPFFPMRLWIHCQMRRTDRFENMTADTLKAICRWKGDAAALESALLGSGFIERSGKTTIIHDWAKTNARLMHNWKAGSTGGRPKKETQGLSVGNPRVISKEPLANPRVSQSRVEKSREDQSVHTYSPNLPGNEKEAAEWAGMGGVPPDFAVELYNQCEGRNWVDGAGQPITKWRNYSAHRWAQVQKAKPERNGTTNPQRKKTEAEILREAIE